MNTIISENVFMITATRQNPEGVSAAEAVKKLESSIKLTSSYLEQLETQVGREVVGGAPHTQLVLDREATSSKLRAMKQKLARLAPLRAQLEELEADKRGQRTLAEELMKHRFSESQLAHMSAVADEFQNRIESGTRRLRELEAGLAELAYALVRLGHGVPKDARVVGFWADGEVRAEVGAPLPTSEVLEELLTLATRTPGPNQGLASLRG